MSEPNDVDRLGEGSYALDPEAGLGALLDDAGEYYAYADAIIEVMAESFAEIELLNRRQLISLIGNLAVMNRMAGQCVRQAKVRWMWEGKAMLGGN